MRRWTIPILLLAFALGVWSQHRAPAPVANPPPAAASTHSARTTQATPPPNSTDATPSSDGLPPEAVETLALIRRGGPFPHRQDGVVFENRERELPAQPRGYYHEYTVETPGSRDRGARRIITGGDPPSVYYYTDDHYRSFRTLEATR